MELYSEYTTFVEIPTAGCRTSTCSSSSVRRPFIIKYRRRSPTGRALGCQPVLLLVAPCRRTSALACCNEQQLLHRRIGEATKPLRAAT